MAQTIKQKITISSNHWRIPSAERAFDGLLVGRMTVAQQAKRLEQVKDARSKWLPTASALALVDELKSLIGETVDIQFWNPIMYWLEDEGPYPLRGVMLDVAILDEGGFPQAYVVLDSPCEIPTPNGFPSIRLLQCRENIPSPLAPVAEIYEVRQV